jgi:hypothetical protein
VSGNSRWVNLTDLASTPFRWGSAIRHSRVFHPDGVLATGYIERVAPDHAGLPVPSSHIVARVSKAVGTAGALPDIIGLALRIEPQASLTTEWDILLASAGSSVIGRAVGLRPVVSWTGKTLTSLAPLRYRGINWWLRARITTRIDGLGVSLNSVRHQLEHGQIDVRLDQARGTSRFSPLADVTLAGIFTPQDDVSFDPVLHTPQGVDMYPPWLAKLRARAYDRSREGRDAS